jgi:MraZ protein
MFRGSHEHAVDVKGRIAIPAKFREELVRAYDDERVVITLHLTEPCLVLHPLLEWKSFEERLAKLPQFDRTAAIVRRLYVGRAQDCTVDKQGRFPPPPRRDSNIDREAIWTGEIKFAELWSKENYEKHIGALRRQVANDEIANLDTRLVELGL